VLGRIITFIFTLALVPSLAEAQALAPAARDRAIRASVLVRVEVNGGFSEGSGSIIDRRGYVLTNFHVVGHMHPFDGGTPGQLFREDGMVTLSHTTSSRAEARPTWQGRVVRTDPEADLALVRIEGRVDGAPIPPGTTFPSVPLAEGSAELGGAVFALGYPLGMRSVTLTSGRITGLDVDADGSLAYLRVDAEFNPGNSGGMLLDADGRLVGIPTMVSRSRTTIAPIRKARPVERVSRDWLRELAEGSITDVRLTGVAELTTNELSIRSAGAGFVVGGEELFFFRVPDGYVGRIQLGVDRTLESPVAANAILLSLDRPRATIRVAANNALDVHAGDGGRLIVVMSVRRRRADGTQPGVSRITARLSNAVGGAGPVMTPMAAEARPGEAYAERPPELEEHHEVGQAAFRISGGLVIDPLEGQDLAGGGVASIGFTASAFALDSHWPFMMSLDYGLRIDTGMWRDAFVFAGNATMGVRLALGSPKFMVEVPLYYSIGIGTIEDEFSFSPYGYSVGLNARIRNFAFGVSWSEAHRGNYSVFRTLDATMGWYF
jgi:S1-C subfamily serine protease